MFLRTMKNKDLHYLNVMNLRNKASRKEVLWLILFNVFTSYTNQYQWQFFLLYQLRIKL